MGLFQNNGCIKAGKFLLSIFDKKSATSYLEVVLKFLISTSFTTCQIAVLEVGGFLHLTVNRGGREDTRASNKGISSIF